MSSIIGTYFTQRKRKTSEPLRRKKEWGPENYQGFVKKGYGESKVTGIPSKKRVFFKSLHITETRYYVRQLWDPWPVGINLNLTRVIVYVRSDYLKILDGNGSVVLHQHRYSGIQENIHLEVGFGNAENITIQTSLSSSYSHFQLSYGTLKGGLQSGWYWEYRSSTESITSLIVIGYPSVSPETGGRFFSVKVSFVFKSC